MDGSIAAEHGIGLIKRDELRALQGPGRPRPHAHASSAALDPQNILNPGKVVAVMEDMPPALPAV